MTERLSTPPRRGRTFMSLVSQETAFWGGFKHDAWGEYVYKGNRTYELYLGFIYKDMFTRNGLHIVIGTTQKGHRRAWYFGTFEGPSWNEMSLEEGERHQEKKLDILQNKNRVPGKALENLILDAVTS